MSSVNYALDYVMRDVTGAIRQFMRIHISRVLSGLPVSNLACLKFVFLGLRATVPLSAANNSNKKRLPLYSRIAYCIPRQLYEPHGSMRRQNADCRSNFAQWQYSISRVAQPHRYPCVMEPF
ncbi:hypothetical protein EAG_12411 [Camponotus floridanus]|uniref:Uncharacterized protein n=1 Tax=Camponotus floridanus TaxID=104421 RepID=E2AWE8_CAMFO|nr:hypothetical protein EAG_12411 [Camponotus floridanus]